MSISMSMYKQKDACKIWDSLIGVTEYSNLLEWDIVIWWVVPIVFKTHNAFITVKYFDSNPEDEGTILWNIGKYSSNDIVSHPGTLDYSERWLM